MMHRERMYMYLVLVMVCLFLAPSLARSQVVTATIYGVVEDPAGALVPGATVTARNVGTEAVKTAETSGAGEFTLTSLPPGEYELTVEASGFKTLRRSGVGLAAGQDARLVLSLEIGAMTETVDITAETPLLNTANPEQQVVLNRELVMDLPIARRDWTQILFLGTGVQEDGGNVRFNGLPPSAFRFTVDGTDASQDTEAPSFSMSGNPNFIKGISTEAIEEVNITRGIASAEIANTMAGNVNITTKSGTNTFHGSLFELFNAEELNARHPLLDEKPNVVYNQFGGSIGGPIIEDKLFFFGAYEGYRLRGFDALDEDVPTPGFKASISLLNPIYDNTFNLFPDPNQPFDDTGAWVGNATAPFVGDWVGPTTGEWVGAGSEQRDDNHVLLRVDNHISDRTILTGRYTRGRPFRLIPRVVTANIRTWKGTTEQATVGVIHSRPTTTFETRFGFNYNKVPRLDALFDLFVEDISVTGIRGSALDFDIDGEVNGREGWSWSIEEVLSKVVGSHSLKFGGIFMRTSQRRENIETPQHSYSTIEDLLNNIPSGRRVTMGVSSYLTNFNTIGFFVQDDFRVNRNLVLNLGLRYDYFSVPKEKDGRLFNFAQPFGLGAPLPSDEIWEADLNNFSPRFGFAYDLGGDGKTVLRGGAGMFHNPRPLFGGPVDIVRNALDEPFRVIFSRQDAIDNPAVFAFPIDNANVTAFVKGGPSIRDTAINTDLPYPLSYQWNLSVQREIMKDLVLDTGYVGTRGLNLMMVRFWNAPDRLTGLNPVPGIGEFRYRDTGENTGYHSWQTSLRKRFAQGASFGVSYTYASSYSYTDDGGLLLPDSPQDVDNWRADRARPNDHVRHAFVTNFTYELPFAKLSDSSSAATRHLLGDWQIAGLIKAASGQPASIEQRSDLQSSRPDFVGSGDPTLSNYRDTLQYLDKSAFAEVPISGVSNLPIRPGNVGRNSITLPGSWDVDLSLSKGFDIKETMKLKFDFEMLNAFNRFHPTDLETRIGRGSFGEFDDARDARVIQAGLRIDF